MTEGGTLDPVYAPVFLGRLPKQPVEGVEGFLQDLEHGGGDHGDGVINYGDGGAVDGGAR